MSEQWPFKKLGDCLEIQNGYAFASKQFDADLGMQLIRIRDLKNGTTTQMKFQGEYDQKFVANKGDLLIGMDGEFVCYEWKGKPSLLNQRVCRLQNFSSELLPRFVYYGINKYLKVIEDNTSYTTVKHLSGKKIKDIDFPIPPLKEQQRIVSILDEAFSKIEHNCIQLQTKITNAEDLFSSILYSEFSDEIETWSESELSEIAYTAGRIGWKGLTAKEYTDSGPLFLSVHSLNYGHYVDFRDANHISQQRYDESPEIMLESNDILICKDGAGIGKLGIVNHVPNPSTINGSLLLIRASEKLVPQFLYYCLLSPYFQSIVQSRLEGSTTPHLYQRDIKKFPVRFPATSLQKEIVEKLDIIAADYENLLNNFSDGMKNFNELKQSILQDAFSGKLTGGITA